MFKREDFKISKSPAIVEIKRLGFLLLIILAIPTIGFTASHFIIQDVNTPLAEEGLNIALICDNLHLLETADANELRPACQEYQEIALLRELSLYAGIIPLSLIFIYFLASKLVGKNRRRIAFIFKPLVLLSIIVVSGMVALQGGILVYAIYIAESYWLGVVHTGIIALIAIGAFLGCLRLIGASFSLLKKENTRIFGKTLSKNEAPEFFNFIDKIAEKLGAKAPNQVVVGLEPSFYVTSSNVTAIDGEQNNTYKGETLYVSAPLMRLMTKDELAAVIGHELAHFRGDDTTYSLKFAPIYRGLETALSSVNTSEEGDVSDLTKLPALAVLSFMHEIFSNNEAAISRDREFIADQAGADISSGTDLMLALAKLSLYSSIWPRTRKTNLERLQNGKIAKNLSQVFIDTAKYDVEHEKLDEIVDAILQDSIEHPTDTHPPVIKRMEALSVGKEEITKENLLVPKVSASSLFANLEQLEEELSILEHKVMVALYQIEVPKTEDDEHDILAKISYSLGAAMINADGKVLPDEISIAEGIGQQIFPKFDNVEFREFINNPDNNPDIDKVMDVANQMLTDKGKLLIYKYLQEIAKADGEIDRTEKKLLEKCVHNLGINLEELNPAA